MDAREQQANIQKLNAQAQGSRKLPIDFTTRTFVLPIGDRDAQRTEKVIKLKETDCNTKQLIFKALYFVYYQTYFDNDQPISLKSQIHSMLPKFMEFLNETTIKNKYNVLKEYEAWRIEQSPSLKTQGTGMRQIKTLLNKSRKYVDFLKTLDVPDIELLEELGRTKVAPVDNRVQDTLTNWFSQISWLRTEEGVGNELYNRLASPKLLIQSMRITTAVTLLEIHKAKHALIQWIEDKNVTIKSMPLPLSNGIAMRRGPSIAAWLERLRKLYRSTPNSRQDTLRTGINLIIYTYSSINTGKERDLFEQFTDAIADNPVEYKKYHKGKCTYCLQTRPESQWMFDAQFFASLIEYAHSKTKKDVPCCDAEHLLFNWLMAMQAVQPSNIENLTLADFRFAERQNKTVESIECTYFKTRAGTTHTTPSINARDIHGKALLAFINDRTSNRTSATNQKITRGFKSFSSAKTGDFSRLIRWMNNGVLFEKISTTLAQHKASTVFLECIHAIVDKGEYNKRRSECDKYPVPKLTFGLRHIKTSSVHARSDNYDPTQLVNYNSHTNETERASYLSAQNEEWLNNCGRITRAVMNDLQRNVYSTDEARVKFHSDFTHAIQDIERRKHEALLTMKIVSQQDSGNIVNVSTSKQNETVSADAQNDLPDTRYVIDCPEVVMRMRHYIAQAEKYHKVIAKNSPEFLFYELLPTLEWMEYLLDNSRFSKDSMTAGKALFEKYKDDLPPLFTAHVGGA